MYTHVAPVSMILILDLGWQQAFFCESFHLKVKSTLVEAPEQVVMDFVPR